jgi:hypothetical protein
VEKEKGAGLSSRTSSVTHPQRQSQGGCCKTLHLLVIQLGGNIEHVLADGVSTFDADG